MSVQPANPATPFYNPNSVYITANPRKRPHTDFAPDTLVKSPTDHLAKVVVEHIHQVDIISPPSSPSKNYSKALQTAKAFDALFSLTPSKMLLERRPIMIPPKPVTYVHRHPDAYTNAITAREKSTRTQEAALRVFLDAFYYKCGFRAWYQSQDYVAGTSSDRNCSDFKGQQTKQYTQEEQKKICLLSCRSECPASNSQHDQDGCNISRRSSFREGQASWITPSIRNACNGHISGETQ